MNLNPAELLNPIFNALDTLIVRTTAFIFTWCLSGWRCWPSVGY
jgi:hypothetical protein